MISVAQARQHIQSLLSVTEMKRVPLAKAAGRILAASLVADHSHPQSDISAMDGYAVRDVDAVPGKTLMVAGEVAAGARIDDTQLAEGTAMRVFTGASLPPGADRVIIQEQVTQRNGSVVLGGTIEDNRFVRPAGCDFRSGFSLDAPRRLDPAALSLAAAMNKAMIPVRCRPDVAIVPSGDELVYPGEELVQGAIVASNIYGLKAMVEQCGAKGRLLPIARDNPKSIRNVLEMALSADLIVTVGGASVGDYDLIHGVVGKIGYEQSFQRIAMRPGKPLMAGRLGGVPHIGLPGNPVSALVCGYVFLLPAIATMLGMAATGPSCGHAKLANPIPGNGPREHYMRATVTDTEHGSEIHAFNRQDSSLLSVMTAANALIVRPPFDPARKRGESVNCIGFDQFVL